MKRIIYGLAVATILALAPVSPTFASNGLLSTLMAKIQFSTLPSSTTTVSDNGSGTNTVSNGSSNVNFTVDQTDSQNSGEKSISSSDSNSTTVISSNFSSSTQSTTSSTTVSVSRSSSDDNSTSSSSENTTSTTTPLLATEGDSLISKLTFALFD